MTCGNLCLSLKRFYERNKHELDDFIDLIRKAKEKNVNKDTKFCVATEKKTTFDELKGIIFSKKNEKEFTVDVRYFYILVFVILSFFLGETNRKSTNIKEKQTA